MNIDVYIIRRNTPENRLLSRLGFDRDTLPVAEWRGKRRSRRGYGKAPVAWRVSGQENVKNLCSGLVRILGDKAASKRTPQEQAVLDRATRTLAALRNRERRALASSARAGEFEGRVDEYLRRRFPCASSDDILHLVTHLEASVRSIDDLLTAANEVLSGRPEAWGRARGEFIRVMFPVVDQQDDTYLQRASSPEEATRRS